MKKRSSKFILLMFCIFLFVIPNISKGEETGNKEWVDLPSVKDVELNKAWSIDFNKVFTAEEIGSVKILKDNISIATEIILEAKNKRIILRPVKAYENNKEYSIRIALSNGNKYRVKFTTKVDKEDSDVDLPEKFDLRTTNKRTNIKNQGATNACWAFATTSALESVLGGDKYDIDPFHLYYNTGYDYIDEIGQYLTAVPYYASWKGPRLENSNIRKPAKLVQDIIYIKPNNNELVKEMIYKYGAVASTLGMSEEKKYWNEDKFCLYKYDDEFTNHAIALVGWDDNFSKENFSTPPATDGAFIVQNSWGKHWGDNGYFYISYHDKSLGLGDSGNLSNIVFSRVEESGYQDNNYQYDELGNTGSFGTSSTESFANVFEIGKGSKERLKSVSFYALDENTSYEIFLVENFLDENSFNNMEKVAKGSFEYGGYYTVDLDREIEVEAGEKIGVVVKINTPGLMSPVAIEGPSGPYNATSGARSNPGESFVYKNGKWEDFYSIKKNANVCLKAFTVNGEDNPLTGLEMSDTELHISIGETYGLYPKFFPANATNKDVIWSVDNKDLVRVDENGIIKGLKAGETFIRLSSLDNKFKASCLIRVDESTSSNKLIKDSDLERIIRANLNKPTGELTKEDLKNVEYLNIENREIPTIKGLEHLENLRYINIQKNNIRDLSPLGKLNNLKSIWAIDNPISDISSLKDLVGLESLTIEDCNVSNIDIVRNFKNLESIGFLGNKIESIEAIKDLTGLKVVDFVSNNIKDIGPLKNLTQLEKLYISANKISNIEPLRNLINLKHLVIGYNSIEDFSPVESYYDNLVNKDFDL